MHEQAREQDLHAAVRRFRIEAHEIDRRLLLLGRRHDVGEGEDAALPFQHRHRLGRDVSALESAEREGLLAHRVLGEPGCGDALELVHDVADALDGQQLEHDAVAFGLVERGADRGAPRTLEIEGCSLTRASSPSLNAERPASAYVDRLSPGTS